MTGGERFVKYRINKIRGNKSFVRLNLLAIFKPDILLTVKTKHIEMLSINGHYYIDT